MHIPGKPPEVVFGALDSDRGRASFWAESAVETDASIEFRFVNGHTCRSEILARRPPHLFSIDYTGGPATFELSSDGADSATLSV